MSTAAIVAVYTACEQSYAILVVHTEVAHFFGQQVVELAVFVYIQYTILCIAQGEQTSPPCHVSCFTNHAVQTGPFLLE